MKKPILYISLTLAAALLFSACGKTEAVIRPGETVTTDAPDAPVAGGGTLQKDGARWSTGTNSTATATSRTTAMRFCAPCLKASRTLTGSARCA